MRLLWITNVLFPNVANKIGYSKTVIGGWTYSAAEELKIREGIELGVVSLYMGADFNEFDFEGIHYYLIPCNGNLMKYSKSLECYCKRVEQSFLPDVAHIYGTEYPITLAYLNACGNNNVVVSLQGLPSFYTRYYLAGITLNEIIKRPILLLEKWSFDRNNRTEIQSLKQIRFFEGRSNWDHTISWAMNPNSQYYHCNRILRKAFYNDKWKIDSIERHSIFLSQAQYSIKGLHQLIKALPYVLSVFPDTNVYVAGDAPYNKALLKDQIKEMGYGRYVKSLIRRNNVADSIIFLGLLSADEMKHRYLSSHVFVCPSSIENVPNSLAEAQILGVPSIASYVGGNSGLIEEGESGFLYRFEEYEMLAKYICDIFSDDSLALKFSSKGRDCALKRHNKENNINTLISIYQDIVVHTKHNI